MPKSQPYHHSTFMLSAAYLKQLPPDEGYEVAFAGRSNAGKSSALNVITQQKRLAKTSKTPGRTQLINLFRVDDERRLVDLPGYGFAKVPLEVKKRWQKTMTQYLETRESLKGLIFLMDIRHPLQPNDQQLLDWAIVAQLPTHILLTKADKLKRGPGSAALQLVKKTYAEQAHIVSVQLFSAQTRQGLDAVYERLNTWFDLPIEDV